MSPEAQRIAIAEWCGWKLMGVADGTKFSNPQEPLIVQRWVNKDLGLLSRKLPDYLNDLNAMWEAESRIIDTRRGMFNAELSKISAQRNLSSAIKEPQFIFDCIHATAAQRAEALLKTIGRWTP